MRRCRPPGPGCRARTASRLRSSARQPPRRRDAELAGVGAGAGRDVARWCPAPASPRPIARERGVQRREQVRVAHPPQHQVLLDRRADRVAGEAARDVGQRRASGLAVMSPSGRRHRRRPSSRPGAAGDTFVPASASNASPGAVPSGLPGRLRRPLVGRVAASARYSVQRGSGGRRRPLLGTSRRNSSIPSLLDQELQARAVAILLLAQPREHARDRLRQRAAAPPRARSGSSSLACCGTAPRPPPTYSSKPRCALAIHLAHRGDGAEVVHSRQAAGARSRQPEKAA